MEETETVLTLADFGALLRERRIHKGLTEENVAAELKITSRLVKAIEEGDMESMPHAVYARGFIRAYAKLLAVDDSVTHAACALLKDPIPLSSVGTLPDSFFRYPCAISSMTFS